MILRLHLFGRDILSGLGFVPGLLFLSVPGSSCKAGPDHADNDERCSDDMIVSQLFIQEGDASKIVTTVARLLKMPIRDASIWDKA